MLKAKKILMVIVAVLLALTLVSTCLVSGIFAKYTTKKAGSFTIGFEKFGVSLSMTLSDDMVAAGGSVTNNNGLSYTATVSNIKMCPGDEFFDALTVGVTGTANVPVKVRMSCKVVYDSATNYKIPKDVSGVSGTAFMPLGFSCKAKGDTSPVAICYSWQKGKSSSGISEIVMRNLADEVLGDTYSPDNAANNDNGTWHFEKSYAKGTNFSDIINEFDIGMYWPFVYGKESTSIPIESGRSKPSITTTTYDAMAAHLGTVAKDSPISLEYTISITQSEE